MVQALSHSASRRKALVLTAFLVLPLLFAGCRGSSTRNGSGQGGVSPFLEEANQTLLRLSQEANQAGWVQQTYITVDTDALSARADQAYVTAVTGYAKAAARLDFAAASPVEQRQLAVLRNTLTMAAPADEPEAAELTRLVTSMGGMYGRGEYCPKGEAPGECLDVEKITALLAKDRDPARLLDVWEGWHTIGPPMKPGYQRFVELSNKGARELGFTDTGAMWRSRYDMPPEAFASELDRLWQQLRPLYVALHTHVRARLRERYGSMVPESGPIPAHLLGNIWAQDWSNIYDIVAPRSTGSTYSLTRILEARRISPREMVRYGERFFTSLGFDPLPGTFWDRSLFVKPRDRDVVCHASAWYIDNADDLRIKMCIDPTAEDFTTVHHELGHTFYAREYRNQPMILRDSANDGFHEAVGDTIALSVTPEYLVKVGLLDKAPDASGDIPLLLRAALERLAFLPFGLVVDAWRWRVFSGEVTPDRYNAAWWQLREQYQGIRPASARGEAFFDAGAKYHVPANTPYARYFLAAVLQFQFHRELAKWSGCTTPLHRCSIYGNTAAGERLRKALAMGASRPWPDALEAITGRREMDASAIADYFAPLKEWLDEQNRGRPEGW
jgi:peptidyl-dipeptidase A